MNDRGKTLTYNDLPTITAVKSFIVQASSLIFASKARAYGVELLTGLRFNVDS